MTQIINVWWLMHVLMLDSSLLVSSIIALRVQSSYKLSLPPYLIIHASNIKMTETIGQGKLTAVMF